MNIKTTDFVRYWHLLNAELNKVRLPEATLGLARGYYDAGFSIDQAVMTEGESWEHFATANGQ